MQTTTFRAESAEASHALQANKACRVHQFGGPDVIGFESIGRLDPREGEVLVWVKAAGVGPLDGWIRAGKSALPPWCAGRACSFTAPPEVSGHSPSSLPIRQA